MTYTDLCIHLEFTSYNIYNIWKFYDDKRPLYAAKVPTNSLKMPKNSYFHLKCGTHRKNVENHIFTEITRRISVSYI